MKKALAKSEINASVRRPPLRYHGSKWRMAPWIIPHFPPHICYVEPFGGGAGVIVRKTAACHDVYNDLDSEVVNFFRMLRDRSEELIEQIELTPYSREELDASFTIEPDDDEIERARKLYLRCWQSLGGGRTRARAGWRFQKNYDRQASVVSQWNRINSLRSIVRRLKEIQIEHKDAFEVIERFDTPETLFYLDPPYLPATRSERWGTRAYQHELEPEDHERLAELLHGIEGMAIISHYPCEAYDELYPGWRRAEKTVMTDWLNKSNNSAIEALYISPKCDAFQSLPLFRGNGKE